MTLHLQHQREPRTFKAGMTSDQVMHLLCFTTHKI
jgi:hypothetical protein